MATTIDIESVVELRRGVDDGATAVAAVLFTEAFVVVATLAAIASNRVAVPLAVGASAAFWGQVRLLRGAPLGFCEPRRIWAFGGLAVGVGVAGSLALGDWLVLGSLAFMTAIVGRPAIRAVRAVRRLCVDRSQPAEPTVVDRLVWRRNTVERSGGSLARLVRLAAGEVVAAVVVVGVVVGLLAADVVPVAGAGRMWIVAVPAMIFTLRARRRIQPLAAERRQIDHRPPATILRTFRDDRLQLKGKTMTIPALSQFRLRACSLEEVISHAVGSVGPPLIIGEPGERLPRLGAAREYVAEESWHEAVLEMMAESQRLFFVLGDTENLAWELTSAVDHGGLARIVIIVPPVGDAEIAERWLGLAARTGLLPDMSRLGPDASAPLIAVFFLGGRPVGVTAGDRHVWSYLVAIWFITAVVGAGIASPSQLIAFTADNLPAAVVSAAG